MVEKKMAMVVAVSKYHTGLQELDFCENDGKGMRDTLLSLGYEISDKSALVGEVGGIDMRDAIFDFFHDHATRSNDIVLFYYSGHGVPDNDTVYLASSDTDPKFPKKRGFSFEDLTSMMNDCTSTRIVTILDSCYSGSARLGKGPVDAAALASQYISKGSAIPDEGKCILAASQSYQEAYGHREGNQSVFTHYLIKGLSGDRESIDSRGNVTPDTLGKYVYDKVTSINPNQKPIRKLEASGEIILAAFPELAESSTGQSSFNVKAALKGANTSFSIGNYAQANSQYNNILQNDPQNVQAWINKGNALENLVMYDEAIRCFNRAIEIDSSDYVSWYNKGNVLARQNRYDDALRCYEAAIQLNSKDPSCWKNKAYVLSKLGRSSEAKQCLDTASSLISKQR